MKQLVQTLNALTGEETEFEIEIDTLPSHPMPIPSPMTEETPTE